MILIVPGLTVYRQSFVALVPRTIAFGVIGLLFSGLLPQAQAAWVPVGAEDPNGSAPFWSAHRGCSSRRSSLLEKVLLPERKWGTKFRPSLDRSETARFVSLDFKQIETVC